MRQFQVPQFIMVEDTVIGPFTIKQFLFVGSGAMIIIFAYNFFQPFLFYPLAFVISAFSAGLAFLKINGQPLYVVIKNAAFFLFKPRLYTWKRERPEMKRPEEAKNDTLVARIPTISESKISDLAWSLDVKHEQTRT